MLKKGQTGKARRKTREQQIGNALDPFLPNGSWRQSNSERKSPEARSESRNRGYALRNQVRRMVAGIGLEVCALAGTARATSACGSRSIEEAVTVFSNAAALGVQSEAVAGAGANDPQQSKDLTLAEWSQQPCRPAFSV
jgi:hypothetical protein